MALHLSQHCYRRRFWAGQDDFGLVEIILGDADDLLLWIPKPGVPRGPSALRALQLPTRFRRLFGAIVVDTLGPTIEPLLSKYQAAKKGGDMGQNISRFLPTWVRLATANGAAPVGGGAWECLWDRRGARRLEGARARRLPSGHSR